MPPSLFSPPRHETLVNERWNEAGARECVDDIVAAAVAGYVPGQGYPPHPLDEMLAGESTGTSPYFGAMGVFWGIAHLSSRAAVPDLREWVRVQLDAMIGATSGGIGAGSLLFGPLPALALRARLQPHTSAGTAAAATDRDAVHAGLMQAADGPVQELMWGIPGGALLADALRRETGEPRWDALLRRQLDAIWAAHVDVPGIGPMWHEDLYGERIPYLGAVHGFAGQALPLVRASALLSAQRRQTISMGIAETLTAAAVRENDCANWPSIVPVPASQPSCLVQYCHGAPGVLACFADTADDVLPGIGDLLLAGGELVWRAGPVAKGSNLCHGTAGNGMALLKLFVRTNDERWLERGRAFAMHAIRQYRAATRDYGRDRFSLFTGDIGLAVFLDACGDGTATMPLVDAL